MNFARSKVEESALRIEICCVTIRVASSGEMALKLVSLVTESAHNSLLEYFSFYHNQKRKFLSFPRLTVKVIRSI
jgi:hypothetical protein